MNTEREEQDPGKMRDSRQSTTILYEHYVRSVRGFRPPATYNTMDLSDLGQWKTFL